MTSTWWHHIKKIGEKKKLRMGARCEDMRVDGKSKGYLHGCKIFDELLQGGNVQM